MGGEIIIIPQQDTCRVVQSKINFNYQSRSKYITTLLKKLLDVGKNMHNSPEMP